MATKPLGLATLRDGTWVGHVAEHIALELQNLAGTDVRHGKTRSTGDHGRYNVIYEYREESVGIEAGKGEFYGAVANLEGVVQTEMHETADDDGERHDDERDDRHDPGGAFSGSELRCIATTRASGWQLSAAANDARRDRSAERRTNCGLSPERRNLALRRCERQRQAAPRTPHNCREMESNRSFLEP